MERFNIINHLFYDGYDLDPELLSNKEYIEDLINIINKRIFNGKGNITVIPYFNGKIKTDGGISGIIVGNNFHFTCHTFSYHNAVFVDFYGKESRKKEVKHILLSHFKTENYDMGSKDNKGNFGKHIILRPEPINFEKAKLVVKKILEDINMTPIMDAIENYQNETNFDILQPIAESHISIHRTEDIMQVDVFSCKYFDVNKLLNIFGNPEKYIEVNRGLKYK